MKISKKALGLIIAGSVTLGAASTAVAAGTARQITATLDSGINVTYNGKVQTLTDASGNAVYPIMYNGSTYLPVRAVSGIFGVKVDWDGPTNTVILGEGGATGGTEAEKPAESAEVNLTSVIGAGNKYTSRVTNTANLIEGGRTFDSAIFFDIWNGTYSTAKYTLAMMDVSGQSKVSFTGWSDIDAKLYILDKDANVIESITVDANTFVDVECDISDFDQISFGADSIKVAEKGTAKFFNPIAK